MTEIFSSTGYYEASSQSSLGRNHRRHRNTLPEMAIYCHRRHYRQSSPIREQQLNIKRLTATCRKVGEAVPEIET